MAAAPSLAQCTIDYSYNPVGANFGLSPDTLPDAVQGSIYNQDLTFLLPEDTSQGGLTIDFTDFHIISINLPLGLTWQCSNNFNGCHYDPSVDQYGCVNVSGVPLQTGSYNVDVELVATLSTSGISIGTESISFSLPFEVLPDTTTSNNAGFSMTGSSGCSPIQVSLINNNVGLLSYFWDFGNGTTSNLAQPADQIYDIPGQYIVQYTAYQSNAIYFLESIEVVTGGCSDNIFIGDVDLLYDISTSSGIIQSVSASNAITQSFPLNINLNNPLQILGQDVTIDVWDDDGWPFGLEYCGGLTFTPQLQSGTFSVNGGGLSINYSVMEIPANTISATDTIFVYDYPSTANILYDTLNNTLSTDSSYFGLQWYFYDSPIPNATDTFVIPSISGLYSLVGINEFGCTSTSDQVLVVICDSMYQPTLQTAGMNIWMVDSALYENVQWHASGLSLLGANMPEYTASESGAYSITATDTFGCAYVSDEVVVCDQNQQPILGVNGMDLWVSDSLSYVSFYWMQSGGSLANSNADHLATYSGLYSVETHDIFGCEYTSAEMLVCDENLEPNIIVFNDFIYTTDSVGYSMQWRLNGVPIASANDPAFLMNESGSYSLVLTDQYGCSYESEAISHNSVVGLNNVPLFLHPNPARKFVEVTGLLLDNMVYEIHNLSGALIKQGVLNDKIIDISVLPPGAYIVRLKVSDHWESVKLLKLNY
tara:strand:- start:339 stop:2462 length:2124 start_codon:yes stop_codon:yes gene_type:complete